MTSRMTAMVSACGLATALTVAMNSAPAAAQSDPPILADNPFRDILFAVDSGWVASARPADPTAESTPEVVYSALIEAPDAAWMMLHFGPTVLAGNAETLRGASLRLTSLTDGAVQRLDAHFLALHGGVSATFNGGAVQVELLAHGGEPASRVRIVRATAGIGAVTPESICGPTDDRQLSTEARTGRVWPIACTGWLINDRNNSMITAGHCSGTTATSLQFNVPLSNEEGTPISPPPSDQYPIDLSSKQSQNSGIGLDWGYMGLLPNSTTGLMPFQAQGEFFVLAGTAPPVNPPRTIRITGYGSVVPPVPLTWNLAQKTHTGEYAAKIGNNLQYRPDTSGGNSGSAVFDETSGMAIGVHTHAGCSVAGGANNGTAVDNASWKAALAAPKGTSALGLAAVTPPVYASNDLVNKLGTVNRTTGAFGSAAYMPPAVQGLAFHRDEAAFYAATSARVLYRVDAGSFEAVVIGTFSGPGGSSPTINGLALDPRNDTLYGINDAAGQLYRIDTATAAVTPIGGPHVGTSVGAIDFDPVRGVLWGINDAGGSRLVAISTTTGDQTLIGVLGAGVTDCDGLASCEQDGGLYVINDANDSSYRVDAATGAATLLGAAGSTFGPVFGMACSSDACTADFNGDGDLNFFDFIEFQDAFAGEQPRADLTGDGSFDFFDFIQFQDKFSIGCPA